MKIRTDFVTNSSSSSFVLSLRFELANGETISWEGISDCGEGAYEYIQLSVRKSPEELGSCESIDALISMVKESIVQGIIEYDEMNSPIFSDDSPFIEALGELSSMEEISKIIIEGYEDTFQDWEEGPYAFENIVTYDMKEKTQTSIGRGVSYIECEGTGGALDFEHEVTMEETPDGYFEEKRSAFFADSDDEDEDY